MGTLTRMLAGGALAATIAAPASAAVIWQDQFNRADSNTVGNGWTEIQNGASDVAISGNALRLRDYRDGPDSVTAPDAAATQWGISTAGYEDIFVQFRWAPLTASESTDTLFVSWKLSSAANTLANWSTLGSFGLGGNGTYTTSGFALGALAQDTSIDLRFWTSVNDDDEGALIDWVTLSGNAIPLPPPPTPPAPPPEILQPVEPGAGVPAPGTLALLGVGLAALGSFRRRR